MITDGGADFDLRDEERILEIDSPQANIGGPYKVLYKDVQERWAVVVLKWNNKPRLGVRWFWDSCGEPNSRGYSTWFVVPPNLSIAVLNGLPLVHDVRLLVDDFLCGKVQEDIFLEAESLND